MYLIASLLYVYVNVDAATSTLYPSRAWYAFRNRWTLRLVPDAPCMYGDSETFAVANFFRG